MGTAVSLIPNSVRFDQVTDTVTICTDLSQPRHPPVTSLDSLTVPLRAVTVQDLFGVDLKRAAFTVGTPHPGNKDGGGWEEGSEHPEVRSPPCESCFDLGSPKGKSSRQPLYDREVAWRELSALITEAQGGSTEPWNEIFRRTNGAVYAFAIRGVKDPDLAEEVVQDAYILMMRKIHQLRDPRAFMGWARSVVRRTGSNTLSRVRSFQAPGDSLQEKPCSTSEPIEVLVASERSEALQAAVCNLRPLDREALQLFHLEGMSLREISDRLGAPLGTIKRRLSVARGRLREALLESGFEPY